MGCTLYKTIKSYLFPAPKMLKKFHGCAFLFHSNGATLSCDISPSSLPGCDGRDSYKHGGRSAYRFDRVSPMDIHKEVFQLVMCLYTEMAMKQISVMRASFVAFLQIMLIVQQGQNVYFVLNMTSFASCDWASHKVTTTLANARFHIFFFRRQQRGGYKQYGWCIVRGRRGIRIVWLLRSKKSYDLQDIYHGYTTVGNGIMYTKKKKVADTTMQTKSVLAHDRTYAVKSPKMRLGVRHWEKQHSHTFFCSSHAHSPFLYR